MTDDTVMINIQAIENAEDFVQVFADLVAEYGTHIPARYVTAMHDMTEELVG